jgi:hypothetical protein
MSDQEFENYLTLIGQLLRLSSTQRKAIGEELRDHFESRLTELVESGMSHTEAVRMALEEFGDAAGLAAQFTTVSQTRRRRLIMRCTVGTVAALAAVLVVAMAAWPERQAGLMLEKAGAQTAEEKKREEKPQLSARDQAAADTEKKLNQYFSASFQETPLTDVAAFVRDQQKLQIFFDSRVLTDAGMDPTTILITTDISNVRVGKFLSLILQAHGLGYRSDDEGFVIISTKEDLDTQLALRIYDCRKILAAPGVVIPSLPASERGEKPADSFGENESKDQHQTEAVRQGRILLVQSGGFGAASSSSTKPATKPTKPTTPAEKLIEVVTGTIATSTWSKQGGPGTIAEYGGLLVISQTQEVHEQIADFLEQLGEKLAAPAAK